MRNAIRITLLLSLAALAAAGQQTEEPSLNDTLAWMQAFVHGHPAFRVSDEFSSSGCQATITETYAYTGFYPYGKIKTRVETVSLSDLDPTAIKYELVSPSNLTHDTGGYVVTMDSTNNQSAIQIEFIDVKGQSKLKTSGKSFGAYLLDADSAHRFGAALKHTVVLCGGKASPF